MKDLIFAAIDKSACRIFFHLENPEISAVLDPKLVGVGGQYFALRQSTISKKKNFLIFSCFSYENERLSLLLSASFRLP